MYSSAEKVLILNWRRRQVAAEHPNPRKLSRVMEEYRACPSREKVQIESRAYPFSSQYSVSRSSRARFSLFRMGLILPGVNEKSMNG